MTADASLHDATALLSRPLMALPSAAFPLASSLAHPATPVVARLHARMQVMSRPERILVVRRVAARLDAERIVHSWLHPSIARSRVRSDSLQSNECQSRKHGPSVCVEASGVGFCRGWYPGVSD